MPQVKSIVYEDFIRLTNNRLPSGRSVIDDYQCRSCGKLLKASSSSRLKAHLDKCSTSSSGNCNRTRQLSNCSNNPGPSAKRQAVSSGGNFPSISEDRKFDIMPECSFYSQASFQSTRFIPESLSNDEIIPITTSLATWIFEENLPLSLTEKRSFRNFIQTICPAYCNSIPTRHDLSNNLLDQVYDTKKKEIENKLCSSKSLTISTDGWTNPENLVNFMVTSGNQSFYLKSKILQGKSCTADFIKEQITSVINELGPDRVKCLITDNTINMKSAWDKLKIEFPKLIIYGCIPQGLNLIAGDIEQLEPFQILKCVAADLVEAIRNHSELRNKFLETESCLVTESVPTRRNSLYDSLKSIIDSWPTLEQMIDDLPKHLRLKIIDAEYKGSVGTFSFLDGINKLAGILNLIKDISNKLEADEANLCDVPKAMHDLEYHLKSMVGEQGQEVWLRREPFVYPMQAKILCALDPKRGHANFEFLTSIKEEFMLFFPVEDQAAAWKEMAQFYAGLPPHNMMSSELDVEFDFGTQLFWRFYAKKAPFLARLAHVLTDLPTSAVCADRVWSTMNNIHSSLGNHLTQDRIDKLAYIHYNSRME